jgi:hypothetical protein
MQTRTTRWIVLTLAMSILLLTACGTLQVQIEQTESPSQTPSATLDIATAAMDIPTTTANPATPTPAPSETPTRLPEAASQWVEVRDPGTGFGFALPCWWITYMPAGESLNYAITVASYDEDYFMANSIKGQWMGGQHPQGAFKLDFYVNKQIDGGLTDEEAVRQALTGTENKVDLLQPRAIGRHSALLAVQSSVNNPSSSGTLYAFRLAPTNLMMVSAADTADLTNPVVQAILSSLALTQEEAVELPAIDPGPALIARPAACQP